MHEWPHAVHRARNLFTVAVLAFACSCARYVVVLANPSSGGRTGLRILQTGVNQLHFSIPNDCIAHFCQLDEAGLDHAVQILSAIVNTQPTAVCRVMVCGGDGSLSWVLQRLVRENLETKVGCRWHRGGAWRGWLCCRSRGGAVTQQVSVGVLPLGTGNDMSRVLGWGSSVPADLLAKGMNGMRRWLSDVCMAMPVWSDMWRVTLAVDPAVGGRIVTVRGGAEHALPVARIDVVMINYLSLGLDAHVVFETEKRRQSTPLANRVMYVLQSTWRTIQGHERVTSVVDSMDVGGTPVDKEALGPQRCLVFLNIASYGGGARIWDTASSLPESHPLASAPFAPRSNPDQGDGRFEFVTIRSLPQLGVHVGFATGAAGGVQKVGQAAEATLRLKPTHDGTTGDATTLRCVFAQIDGEGYRLEGPVSVTLMHFARARVLMLAPPSHPQLFRGKTV